MLFVRTAVTATRGVSGLRAFSTARVFRAELAYQVYGPEKEQATRDPILFLHGLFGSKQNNRSISKYAIAMLAHSRFEPNIIFQSPSPRFEASNFLSGTLKTRIPY